MTAPPRREALGWHRQKVLPSESAYSARAFYRKFLDFIARFEGGRISPVLGYDSSTECPNLASPRIVSGGKYKAENGAARLRRSTK